MISASTDANKSSQGMLRILSESSYILTPGAPPAVSLAVATHQIRRMVAEAREEYRASGAPYGDDDQSFCRWLIAKPRLTPSA